MVGRTKTPTKAEQRRMDLLKREVGCVACDILNLGYVAPDIHHITDCGKRMGHEYTIPLCPWHHRGVEPCPGFGPPSPSLAKSKRGFEAAYGTELQLLAYTNHRLAQVEANIIGGPA